MRALARKAARQALFFGAPLAASLLSSAARADDTSNKGAPPTPAGTTTAPSAAPADTSASSAAAPGASASPSAQPATTAPPPPPPDAAAPPPAAPITYLERMPSSAFPTDPIRGIYGGSLWSIFHGKQFPYYPKTGIGVSGYAWIDTGYENITRGGGQAADPGIKYWLQQGRFLLRVTPTWSDGKFFVQAQAEMVANRDQTQTQPIQADVDDIWVKAGQWNAWDIQVGRYEAWEVYHFGMGLDLFTLERNGATDAVYTVPSIYGLTYAFYRPNGIGAAAVHLYPTKNLRFELSTQEGNEESQNGLAARPVAIYDLGWMKLKGGWEYRVETPQNDGAQGSLKQQGLGGAIQFVVDPILEFGANGAYGWQREIDAGGEVSRTASFDTYSVGGFANLQLAPGLVFGAGYNYTYLVDQHYEGPPYSRNEKYDHTQTFIALQYRPISNTNFFIKVVGAYALGRFAPTYFSPIYNDDMFSSRIRFQYLF